MLFRWLIRTYFFGGIQSINKTDEDSVLCSSFICSRNIALPSTYISIIYMTSQNIHRALGKMVHTAHLSSIGANTIALLSYEFPCIYVWPDVKNVHLRDVQTYSWANDMRTVDQQFLLHAQVLPYVYSWRFHAYPSIYIYVNSPSDRWIEIANACACESTRVCVCVCIFMKSC